MKSSEAKHYPSLIGQSIENLEALLTSIDEPSYRGRQLLIGFTEKEFMN